VHRRLDALFPSQPHHRSTLRLQLRRAAGDDVALHGGGPLRRQGVGEGERLLHRVVREGDAVGPGHGQHLAHRALEQVAGLGAAPEHADGRAGDGAEAAHRRDEEELAPQLGPDILERFGGDAAAAAERLLQSLRAAAQAAGQLAEADVGLGALVADHAGGLDPGDDTAEAAEDALGAEDGGELGGGLDAVLERDDEAVGAEGGRNGAGGVGDLPGFDGKEDGVGGAEIGGVVGGLNGLDGKIAFGAGDAEAAFAEGPERFASGDEDYLLAGLGEATAEIGADGTGPEDADAQRSARFVWSRQALGAQRVAWPHRLDHTQFSQSTRVRRFGHRVALTIG